MEVTPTNNEIAAALGVSKSHVSNILSGTRQPSADIALSAFRHFGLRLGLLAEMTDADIEKLCASRCQNESTPAPDQGANKVNAAPERKAA